MLKNIASKPAVKFAAILATNVVVVVVAQIVAAKVADAIDA